MSSGGAGSKTVSMVYVTFGSEVVRLSAINHRSGTSKVHLNRSKTLRP